MKIRQNYYTITAASIKWHKSSKQLQHQIVCISPLTTKHYSNPHMITKHQTSMSIEHKMLSISPSLTTTMQIILMVKNNNIIPLFQLKFFYFS